MYVEIEMITMLSGKNNNIFYFSVSSYILQLRFYGQKGRFTLLHKYKKCLQKVIANAKH